MRESRRHQALLVAFAATVCFTRLGATHLWDLDEAFYGRIAREMVASGDYVVPTFNGALCGHKPPLMFWIMAAGFRLFGETEFAARVGGAAFGVGTVLLTYRLGRLLFSPAVGLWGGLALASCLNFALIARSATADPSLVFFTTLPLLIVAGGLPFSGGAGRGTRWRASDVSWPRWAAAYAATGAAALAKGPVGVVLPIAALGLFLLLVRDDGAEPAAPADEPFGRRALRFARLFRPAALLRTAWEMRPLTAVAAVGLVALPWYVAVGARTDGEWLRDFFLTHNASRFTASMEGHDGGLPASGLWYYVAAICIGTFPWCMFNYQAARATVAGLSAGRPERPALLLLVAWIAVWVGAFSAAGTKLPHYVLPAYPALALLFGRVLDRWLAGDADPSRGLGRGWLRASWATPVVVGLGLLAVVPFVTRIYAPGEERLALLGLIPLAGGAAGWWADERRHRRRWAAALLATTAAAFSIALFAWAAVRIDRHQPSPIVAGWIREMSPSGEASVAAAGGFEASLLFYCDRCMEKLAGDRIAGYFADHPAAAFVVATDADLIAVPGGGPAGPPPGVRVLRQTPRFLRPGRVLLLGREE